MTTRKLTQIALMTAVISVLSPLSIPLAGEVPISLATFAVMLCGVLLGAKEGLICTALYLVLGAIGVPVFAGYTSGVGIIAGVTGGFLIGYMVLAFCSGLFASKKTENRKAEILWTVAGMLVGNVLLYILGIIWFVFVTKSTIMVALTACVIPFIPGDIVKMVVVCLLAGRLKKIVNKAAVK